MTWLRRFGPLAAAVLIGGLVASCGDSSFESEECPAYQCSDRGQCTTENLRPTCACDAGYVGNACQACDVGYERFGDACIARVLCGEESCEGHGACDDSTGSAVCTCEDEYSGRDCELCAPGFHRSAEGMCTLDAECFENTCSGRGVCESDGMTTECECDEGFGGTHCDEFDACADDPCGDRGRCEESGPMARCICDDGYAGAGCESCYVGYHRNGDEECVRDEICEESACSFGGSCSAEAGVVTCECRMGYEGDECEACAEGFHRNAAARCVPNEACPAVDPCGVGGTCSDVSGEVLCACQAGYEGPSCELCVAGYHREGEECLLNQRCNEGSCNGGACDDGSGVIVCACPSGFDGPRCRNNIDDCDHGMCTGTAGAPGMCLDLVDDYVCLCPSMMYGTSCP